MSLIRVALAKIEDYHFELIPGGGCDIAHARNLMLHYARTRTNAKRIVYIDADEVFGPPHVEQLVRRMVEDPEVRYLAGLYPLKGMELRWSYGGWSKLSAKTGLWEVFEVATGFTGIDLDLVDEMLAANPEWAYEIEDYEYKGETGHEVFVLGQIVEDEWVPDRRYRRRMPEDFMFSYRARQHGETVYVDPTIQLGHIGTMDMLKLHKPGTKEVTQGHA